MKTKKVIIAMAIGVLLLFNATTTEATEVRTEKVTYSEYSEGFQDGYCQGWKYVKGEYALCPIPPITPIPDLDCSSGYTCGYNRGFAWGMSAARN